jgi:hypothetical protein
LVWVWGPAGPVLFSGSGPVGPALFSGSGPEGPALFSGSGPEGPEPGKCVVTGKPSTQRVVFAKAY